MVVAATALGASLGAVRPYPRAAWTAGAVALLAAAALAAPSDALPGAVYVLLIAHGFGAGRWNDWRAAVAGIVVLIGAAEVYGAVTGDEMMPLALLPAAAWAAGRALGEREKVASQLAERAWELEEEREAHAALSVRYERARIASELHDIVAHAISVMVVQASAGQRLAAQDPELTAEAFQAIAGAAHQAEEDMGRLVALLGDEGAIGPAPDLALVEELVGRAAGSGLDVRLRLEGERDGLPAAVVEAAYRVVQEGLTNALRYASGAAVTVLVAGEADALVVEVDNAPATKASSLEGSGTGNGLRGPARAGRRVRRADRRRGQARRRLAARARLPRRVAAAAR